MNLRSNKLLLSCLVLSGAFTEGATACSSDGAAIGVVASPGPADASSSDATASPGPGSGDTAPPSRDSGAPDTTPTAMDAGAVDTSTGKDAPAEASPKGFCASHPGLAFCADFDEPGAIDADAGASGWDDIVSQGTEVTISVARAVSTPSSLLTALASSNGDRSAKVVKTVRPAGGLSQALYAFDVYLDALPANPGAGGFITDLQFTDTAAGGGSAQDQFGFRIAVFSTASGGFDHAEFQHNAPALPSTPDDVVDISALDAGASFTSGAWNHVEIAVAFSAAGDAGQTVGVQLYVNHDPAPAVDKTYPSPFASAPFARVADGVVFAFNGGSKDYGIYYDNVTLKLQ